MIIALITSFSVIAIGLILILVVWLPEEVFPPPAVTA
jgi:hypothetical protein